jgi:dsDNA-specific endonuclease/ATPase MutS2
MILAPSDARHSTPTQSGRDLAVTVTMTPEPEDAHSPDPIEWPITRELDLHSFRPADVAEVLDEYLRLCHERGWREVRVVHGKGIGQLRQTVHARLSRNPLVETFALATETYGGHGATWVRLKDGSGDA